MCYTGGPRCSGHALTEVSKAKRNYREAIASGDVDAGIEAKKHLDEANEQFYMTPKGWEYLESEIKATGDPTGELEFALEYGKIAREEALAKNKARGQIKHKNERAENRKDRLDRQFAEQQEKEKAALDELNAKRKAEGRLPLSKFNNLTLDAYGSSGYASYDSSLIPQANDLEKVSSVVDAIDNGANTAGGLGESFGIDSRQGNYYGNAAEYIGLVQRSESMDNTTEYELTANGKVFKDSSAAERAVMMRELVNSTPVMKAYIESGRDKKKLEEYIRDSGSYESSVATRRAHSIVNWDKKLNSSTFESEIGTSLTQVSATSAKVGDRIRQERINKLTKLAGPKDYGTCMDCFSKLPATGVCDCKD
ncbi:MAG: hypothetical protein H9W81_12610 [Enterococcus sp.]|nr:hypothetical protein [Enterococcus sp.]